MNATEGEYSRVERFLHECGHLPDQPGNPELTSIRAAILIEDAFDVVLTDEEFKVDLLGNPKALRQLLAKTPTDR